MARAILAIFMALAVGLPALPARADTPREMMAECRVRAHEELRARLGDIETKYEGRRTDGTHAVNGTAQGHGRTETFQCSFDRSGRRIARFIVNHPAGHAADPSNRIETRLVRFHPGSHVATVEGRIAGDKIIDYLLVARAGQHANISMASRNGSLYFNILAPGENEVAMFNGSTSGNQFEGVLPKEGEYKIRVYLMRNAARRNEAANFRMELIGDAPRRGPAARQSTDAIVPGTNFHATGTIPCAMGGGQPTGQCPFGVTREGRGKGMVTITKPDGRKRVIFFEGGKATGYDVIQADPGAFHATRQSDLNIIRIGQERYEIPDAVVLGG